MIRARTYPSQRVWTKPGAARSAFRSTTVACVFALIPACAGDLDDAVGSDEGETDDAGPPIVIAPGTNNELAISVNATDDTAWVYLDLDAPAGIEVVDPATDVAWDLGFLRFHVKLNGGVSGHAGVEAAIVEVPFEQILEAPAAGYAQDAADGDDMNADPDYVFKDWYAYDVATHVLTPYPLVYVVHSSSQRTFKVQIQNYYDEHGTSAHFELRAVEL